VTPRHWRCLPAIANWPYQQAAGPTGANAMRNIIISLFAFTSLTAYAGTLTVDISGISKASGTLKIRLDASADGYNGKIAPLMGKAIKISDKKPLSVSFADLPAGEYAISVMHDENDNGELDSNILGIPKEAYGFSNNPRVMRKPRFDETKFTVGADAKTIAIELL
jgi:uncharacterized protein (DUF2141 family)